MAMRERASNQAPQIQAEVDPWLSMSDVAERLHVSKDTVSDWIAKRGLVGKRLPSGRLWRIRASALDAWMESLSEEAQP
jgi:excisionase family DNA binding protein